MENKGTIYKGEVMHDLKALFDNAGDYFEDEYELVKQYIEQLEQALDKATIAFPELLIKLMRIFYDSFINYNMELIIIPKNNTYFRVDNIKTELDIKRKVLESRAQPLKLCRIHLKGVIRNLELRCLTELIAF